ncbi:MAG TPA: CBS domain-containing protein [Candidatus Saccharimonadales bacterium]|nr:CBS domain-containing protein [Candidatus Saccharimonadales bacterium]
MARCPSCEFENVPGVELCEKCGQDLLDTGVPVPEEGVQAAILDTPLQALGPDASIIVDKKATVAEAMRLMREKKHGSVLVLDGKELAGIFTERDVLLKIVCRDLDPAKTAIGDVMTVSPQRLNETDPLAYAIHLMAVRGFRHIPVMNEGGVSGIISIRGVIRSLTEKAL